MAKSTAADEIKLIAQNRRASFNYELSDRWEAGLVLMGSEVKTLRHGSCDLSDGWVSVDNGEAFLKGVFMPKLEHAAFAHEERRPRKLLLRESEIERLRRALAESGATVVPTRIYWKNGRAKVEIAIGKGKQKADKREAVKTRELDREARAAMGRAQRGR
ncbi:MAG TPA: SsrA-binding protein SmpB [Polyangiaceae bacterium]|nr:SsrA-binding protein SmpB [Polyangiaceae bacterium]